VDNDHDEEPSESHMRILLASITSLVGDADYNGHGFSFSLDIACKGTTPIFKCKMRFHPFEILPVGCRCHLQGHIWNMLI
jgi:hypothetical protein